jgi:hypothetical protein
VRVLLPLAEQDPVLDDDPAALVPALGESLRRPFRVDLDELRLQALAAECDRRGHPRGPAAGYEDALGPAHVAASSPPTSADRDWALDSIEYRSVLY